MKRSLGGVLKDARIEWGWSLEQLGALVDADPSYLSYLETGVRQPSLELLSRLARALRLKPDRLFLLAHPDEAPGFIRSQKTGRDSAWRAFTNNKPLLERYKVQRHELEFLAQANRLGQIVEAYDFLFILNSIRQAMDSAEHVDAMIM